MSIHNITQDFEMKFWHFVIDMLDEDGPIVTFIQFFKRIMDTRIGSLALLIIVWASVGFIAGLIIGKLVSLVQIF
jgi:hypothetical protein